MIKLTEILQEVLNQQQIVDLAKEFMNSKNYNSNHDCKRSTFEFIKWVKKNKEFEPIALLLAPPKDIKTFPGKSGDGDSHIFSIIDGYGVDFTADQFPGVSEPLKITPESQIPSEYKKIGGYYTLYPDWFENGKTLIKTKFNNLPQWFRDGFEKEGFKPDLNESIDKIAGVWDTDEKFKDGSDFKIKFKVSNIIDLAKNTPVKEIDPKSIKYNFSGRQDSDPSKTKERVMKADLSYPIIAVKNEAGKIFAMLDGTHRLEKALNLGLDKIKTKILDKEDLIQFKTDKLKENIKLTDILLEILTEKKLCPKGKAYYNRRKAAGEKPSAYLSGRAVKVCKGLMEEDDLDMHESLRDWFKKEDWVRIDTAGNITGPCGTMKKGNKTTRCLPRAKANSLSKAERAATSKKKAASDKQFVPNTKKAKVKLNK